MRFRWSEAVWPLLALLVPCLVFATPYEGDEWLPGHLIVNFKASIGTATPTTLDDGIVSMGIPSVDELLSTYQVQQAKRLVPDGILSRMEFPPDFSRLYILHFPTTLEVIPMIADFEANPYIQYAEPDLLRIIHRTPNDPMWGNQWDKAIMNCPAAWDYGTGDSTIIVCAIDTGTDWNHPDLTPTLWVNPGEDLDGDGVPWEWDDIPGDPDDWDRIDNDGNGYEDDLIGWDFIDNLGGCATGEDCDDPDNDPFGLEPHGTHCLGLMAAKGNNSIGVAGCGWDFTGMAVRAGYLASDGNGYMPQSATLPAIAYATAMGAKIISMSYGGNSGGTAERNAMEAAWNNGVLLFGAAGNEPTEQMHYPACHPYVISVASTRQNDALSTWSNRGTWLDLCAPGEHGIWSTIINGYGGSGWGGTSMACPNAGGVAALIWNMIPEFTNADMDSMIMNYSADISAQNPGINPAKLGAGRIDAGMMLATRFPHLSFIGAEIIGDSDDDGRLETGESGDLLVTIENDDGWATATNIRGRVFTDDPNLTLTDDSVYFDDLIGGLQGTNTTSPVYIAVSHSVAESYWTTFTLEVTADYVETMTWEFQIEINFPPVLLVDDDGGNNYDAQFSADFNYLELGFDKWNPQVDGSVTADLLSSYREVFWACGNEETETLTEDDQTALATFLDAGGKLALMGRLIDRDLRDDDFYADYLHCESGELDSLGRGLTGVDGDEISDGTSLLLLGSCANNGGTNLQSRIVPLAGASVIYTYDEDNRPAAVKYGDTTTYQVVYFAFALEAACGVSGTTHHRIVTQRILEWFGQTLSAVEPPKAINLPAQYALLGNYPNPFNPTTTISYDVRTPGQVTLKVYDIMGRLATTLYDGNAQIGRHQVQFDGSGLASGIYFVHMTAPGYSSANKMVLLK
ncbi:S8 family peptidase [bacterium]|nr:S8 family peptidase [bacterium]